MDHWYKLDDAPSRRAGNRAIRRAMDAPLLTRDREFALARAWRDEGDETALCELVTCHTRLAISLAAKYRHYGLPVADLAQEGVVGLLQAASRFDPDRNVRFSTYSSWWIRSAIQDYVLRNWSIVRTGTTAAQKSLFFNFRRLRSRLEGVSGDGLDPDGRQQIAESLDVALRDVEIMESRLSASDQSLDAFVYEGGDETWQTLLPDEGPTPEDIVIESRDGLSRSRWIQDGLSQLSERERMIICARRLTEESVTLEQLGRELGVSKERVRQLESRALAKLRTSFEERVERPADLIFDT